MSGSVPSSRDRLREIHAQVASLPAGGLSAGALEKIYHEAGHRLWAETKLVQRSGECDRCQRAAAAWRKLSERERRALATTGFTGEVIDGRLAPRPRRGLLLVIGAVFLPRRGVMQFADMVAPGRVSYDSPAFLCPWSNQEIRPVLRHGPRYASDAGQVDELDLDYRGLMQRASHCPLSPVNEYLVRPFSLVGLKRRVFRQRLGDQ